MFKTLKPTDSRSFEISSLSISILTLESKKLTIFLNILEEKLIPFLVLQSEKQPIKLVFGDKPLLRVFK